MDICNDQETAKRIQKWMANAPSYSILRSLRKCNDTMQNWLTGMHYAIIILKSPVKIVRHHFQGLGFQSFSKQPAELFVLYKSHCQAKINLSVQ